MRCECFATRTKMIPCSACGCICLFVLLLERGEQKGEKNTRKNGGNHSVYSRIGCRFVNKKEKKKTKERDGD